MLDPMPPQIMEDYIGITDLYIGGDQNSKSIEAGEIGEISLFYPDFLEHDKRITLQYTNIRNFRYEQILRINVEINDIYDYTFDKNGKIIDDMTKFVGQDKSVYIFLEEQKPIGFVEPDDENDYLPYEI